MDRENYTRNSGNKTLLIIVAIGGPFLVLCATCDGIFGWSAYKGITTDLPAAEASADAFFDLLKAGKIDEAYASTTPKFQTVSTIEAFREFVGKFSILKSHNTRTYGNTRIFDGPEGKEATLQVTLFAENNALSCTIFLRPINGQWKVHHLNVP